MLGTLHPIASENIEVGNILWTTEDYHIANSPAELLGMLPESSFQPEQNNSMQLIHL